MEFLQVVLCGPEGCWVGGQDNDPGPFVQRSEVSGGGVSSGVRHLGAGLSQRQVRADDDVVVGGFDHPSTVP